MSEPSDFKIIQPSGVLSGATMPEIAQQVNDFLQKQVKLIMIDLQNVNFIDSAGLGALISLHTKMRLAGGKLYLCSPQEQAKGLFDITDTDRVFETFSSLKEFYAVVIYKNQAVMLE